jgi:mono/diheme cytochrome c family protein
MAKLMLACAVAVMAAFPSVGWAEKSAPVRSRGERVAGSSGPVIVVEEGTDFSFGKVAGDRAVEHVFTVRNDGNKPLVITRVMTSCGCTAAMMESSVIDPGKTGRLRISFNPKGQKGAATRTVTVFSNDPANESFRIKVSVNVVEAGEEGKPDKTPVRAHEKKGKLVFSSECLACHGPRKARDTGLTLYASACAACHGAAGTGVRIAGERIAPHLSLRTMTVKTVAGIRQVIAAGTGSPAMPGFGKEYGGPLANAQVDSLVDLIIKEFSSK